MVQNRLEQLRKRQRDEALLAQEELLAGVVKSIRNAEAPVVSEDQLGSEEAEPYDRSMSPVPIDITKLPFEDRQIDIITATEDLRALVRYCTMAMLHRINFLFRLNAAVL